MLVASSATRALACSPYSRRGRGEIDSRASFFQFLEPPRKETTLGLLPSQGKRLLIRSTGLRKVPQPATQIRTGGVRERIPGEFLARQKVID